MSALRTPRQAGKVRAARLTDLAALGELSRLCQSDGADTRSLGLPVNGPPIGVFSLFRLPLGAFRPNDLMFVYEEEGRIAGLVRVEREADPRRVDDRRARRGRDGQRRRHPLPARPAAPARGRQACRRALPRRLRRRRRQRRAADAGGLHALRRGAGPLPQCPRWPSPKPWSDERAAGCGIRATTALDALPALAALCGRDALTGRPARGYPPRRLGAPGRPLARAALEPHADPALRRRRGLRPGHERRRQGRDAARRVPPGRRRQGGPAALPQDHRPARRGRHRPRRLRSRGHQRANDEGRRPSPRPRRHRPGPHLRIAHRPAPGGRRLRIRSPASIS